MALPGHRPTRGDTGERGPVSLTHTHTSRPEPSSGAARRRTARGERAETAARPYLILDVLLPPLGGDVRREVLGELHPAADRAGAALALPPAEPPQRRLAAKGPGPPPVVGGGGGPPPHMGPRPPAPPLLSPPRASSAPPRRRRSRRLLRRRRHLPRPAAASQPSAGPTANRPPARRRRHGNRRRRPLPRGAGRGPAEGAGLGREAPPPPALPGMGGRWRRCAPSGGRPASLCSFCSVLGAVWTQTWHRRPWGSSARPRRERWQLRDSPGWNPEPVGDGWGGNGDGMEWGWGLGWNGVEWE